MLRKASAQEKRCGLERLERVSRVLLRVCMLDDRRTWTRRFGSAEVVVVVGCLWLRRDGLALRQSLPSLLRQLALNITGWQ